MENEIGVGEFFFLNFFSNFQFDISKKDKNKCPKWKNEIENLQKSLEKKFYYTKEGITKKNIKHRVGSLSRA
jgi:hypothetical protein